MKPHVLIVEDNFILAEELGDLVEQDLGGMPVIRNSAEAAIRLLPDAFQLAILDIEVVDGNTYPVARVLRDKGIPFIFVSGNDPDSVPPEFRDAPFISKPYRKEALVRLAKSASGSFH